MIRIAFMLVVATTVANCVAVTEGNPDWWKTAVFYQIYPRSFKDSNDDGIGDLQGISSKLQYLHDLGVNATWLSPIFQSPQVDQGYDISDYRTVDNVFGSNEELLNLIEEAKKLGIKIILDFVPNHTSDRHYWFNQSLDNDEYYKDFYIWREGRNNNSEPPNNWLSNFKGSAWTYREERQMWYYHNFAEAQPDLNYNNPKVVQAMKDVLTYWLDNGVGGFRVDAVQYLFEDESFKDEPQSGDENAGPNDYEYLKHIYTSDLDKTYDMIYQWRDLMENYTKTKGGDDRIFMTEAWTTFNNTMLYYGTSDGSRLGAHFTFNFDFIASATANSSASDLKAIIDRWITELPSRYVPNWVLGNHDRHRVATRYGVEHVDALTMMQAILPGVQITYNGEEIGMVDGQVTCQQGHDPIDNANCTKFDEVSRDFERTPFQWDTTINAGFSKADPQSLWLPVGKDYKTTNVAVEEKDNKSHLSIYKTVVSLRHSIPKEATTETNLEGNVLMITRNVNSTNVYHYVYNRANEEAICNLPHKLQHSTYKIIAVSGKSTYSLGDVVEQKLKLASNESLILSEIENSDDAASGLAITYITFFSIIIGMLNIIQ